MSAMAAFCALCAVDAAQNMIQTVQTSRGPLVTFKMKEFVMLRYSFYNPEALGLKGRTSMKDYEEDNPGLIIPDNVCFKVDLSLRDVCKLLCEEERTIIGELGKPVVQKVTQLKYRSEMSKIRHWEDRLEPYFHRVAWSGMPLLMTATIARSDVEVIRGMVLNNPDEMMRFYWFNDINITKNPPLLEKFLGCQETLDGLDHDSLTTNQFVDGCIQEYVQSGNYKAMTNMMHSRYNYLSKMEFERDITSLVYHTLAGMKHHGAHVDFLRIASHYFEDNFINKPFDGSFNKELFPQGIWRPCRNFLFPTEECTFLEMAVELQIMKITQTGSDPAKEDIDNAVTAVNLLLDCGANPLIKTRQMSIIQYLSSELSLQCGVVSRMLHTILEHPRVSPVKDQLLCQTGGGQSVQLHYTGRNHGKGLLDAATNELTNIASFPALEIATYLGNSESVKLLLKHQPVLTGDLRSLAEANIIWKKHKKPKKGSKRKGPPPPKVQIVAPLRCIKMDAIMESMPRLQWLSKQRPGKKTRRVGNKGYHVEWDDLKQARDLDNDARRRIAMILAKHHLQLNRDTLAISQAPMRNRPVVPVIKSPVQPAHKRPAPPIRLPASGSRDGDASSSEPAASPAMSPCTSMWELMDPEFRENMLRTKMFLGRVVLRRVFQEGAGSGYAAFQQAVRQQVQDWSAGNPGLVAPCFQIELNLARAFVRKDDIQTLHEILQISHMAHHEDHNGWNLVQTWQDRLCLVRHLRDLVISLPQFPGKQGLVDRITATQLSRYEKFSWCRQAALAFMRDVLGVEHTDQVQDPELQGHLRTLHATGCRLAHNRAYNTKRVQSAMAYLKEPWRAVTNNTSSFYYDVMCSELEE